MTLRERYAVRIEKPFYNGSEAGDVAREIDHMMELFLRQFKDQVVTGPQFVRQVLALVQKQRDRSRCVKAGRVMEGETPTKLAAPCQRLGDVGAPLAKMIHVEYGADQATIVAGTPVFQDGSRLMWDESGIK